MNNKISPYWICQLFGWFLSCLYWVEGMISCDCISIKNASINLILTFGTGILVTHLFAISIKHYKLQKALFPRVIYYIVLYIILISVSLWIVNIFINYYTYKEHYYLQESKYDNISTYIKGSFDMYVVFARIASTWVLAYFLYHLGRRGNEAEKEKAAINKLYVESSLDHLRKQINPHFMFNSLNSVKALISENPEKARRAVVLLAEVLRNSLNSSSHATIPLHEELDHCKDYLEMEKIRFEDRLQYEISIDKKISDFTLPPLSLLTLVENAIKHGLGESIKACKISIDCREEGDTVLCTVANDGRLKTDNPKGLGIKNLGKRFEFLYKDNFTFSVSEKNEKVIAQFKLPKETAL